MIDKALIAARFAKARHSYTEHAVVQKQICDHLLQLMQRYIPAQLNKVFEIGCGSGNLTRLLTEHFHMQQLILNDLYPQVRQLLPEFAEMDVRWLIGDIEQLEFPQQLDLIASSSALQWLNDLDGFLAKVHQALNPQAYLCFSTFGPQNLIEIKTLTGQGLSYLALDELRQKLEVAGFEILCLEQSLNILHFEHPHQVLRHLKATGVTATAQGHQRWSKTALQEFYQQYQQQFAVPQLQHQAEQYSLTYHPIFCVARRTS